MTSDGLPHQARLGWTSSYEGALHDKSGGRLSRLQMLTGSTLPLLPLLEGLVKKHASSLTKRDQAVAAMRVQMGERRLVGAPIASDGLGWPRMASDGLGWPRMASNGLGWPRMASECLGVPRSASDGLKWPRMASDCLEWPRIASLIR